MIGLLLATSVVRTPSMMNTVTDMEQNLDIKLLDVGAEAKAHSAKVLEEEYGINVTKSGDEYTVEDDSCKFFFSSFILLPILLSFEFCHH